MLKLCTVIGARPQFIKAATLSRILRSSCREVLIHTGQHYDQNMSDIFFDELTIPKPDYHLDISGGTHGAMTGRMLSAIEDILCKEEPDMVMVYGDTNSTLAGALAAVKLHIPISHVEAGVRTGSLISPEEVNRVLTDRISSLLMCCTEPAIESLKKEGITEGVYLTGDLMYDAALYYGDIALKKEWSFVNLKGDPVKIPDDYYLLTCHREENTQSDEPLYQILSAMEGLDCPAVYPVHPRNKSRADRLCRDHHFKNVLLIQPVGYLASLHLIKNAKKVITDSGGVQREAWFFDKPCVTLLDYPAWPETHSGNMNQLCRPLRSEILDKLNVTPDFTKQNNPFGDGHAAEKIAHIISHSIFSQKA